MQKVHYWQSDKMALVQYLLWENYTSHPDIIHNMINCNALRSAMVTFINNKYPTRAAREGTIWCIHFHSVSLSWHLTVIISAWSHFIPNPKSANAIYSILCIWKKENKTIYLSLYVLNCMHFLVDLDTILLY